MRATLFASVLALFALLAACESLGGPTTSDADLRERIVDTEQLLDLLRDTKKPAILIDVRSPEKYAAAHIPGALNLPLPRIREADPRLAEAGVLIVTGDGWSDILTPAAAKKLIALKYQNVHAYRGGMELWQQEGRDVAEGAEPGADPARSSGVR